MPDEETLPQSIERLTHENKVLSVRIRLANAFVSLWVRAYDALLHHGVNIKELREYKDTKLLDEGLEEGSLEDGGNKVFTYLQRLESGLVAAIRRKSMRPVK